MKTIITKKLLDNLYWKQDKRRLKTYKKYGYKTLIIWEHELKNLDKVKNRILKFNK